METRVEFKLQPTKTLRFPSKSDCLKKISPVNNTKGKVRIDRFLWATRNFKTRSLSTDACKRNWITINNTTAKASREIKMGDTIKIKQPSHLKTFKVIQLLDKRIGAKLVKCYIEDLTPEEEYEKERVFRKNRKLYSISSSARGRPSKKQRRDLEEFLGQANETDS